MTKAAVDLLTLADAVLARRSRVHAPKDREHVNTAPHASGLVPHRPPLSGASVNRMPASREQMNVVDPLADDFEERAALAEYPTVVPREWAEGFARLQVSRPPAGLSVNRWRQVIDDGGRFIDRWAAHAAALGWRTLDVFGVHAARPVERFDAIGLVWAIRGSGVIDVTDMTATMETPTGARQTFYRRPGQHPEAVAIWTLEHRDGPARAVKPQ